MRFRTSRHHIADVQLFPDDFDHGRIRNINALACRRIKSLALPDKQACDMFEFFDQPHPICDLSAVTMAHILNNAKSIIYVDSKIYEHEQ